MEDKMENINIVDNFEIEKVKAKDKRDIVLSVRITRKDFEWIKTNRISASKFFNYFLQEVMKKEETKK